MPNIGIRMRLAFTNVMLITIATGVWALDDPAGARDALVGGIEARARAVKTIEGTVLARFWMSERERRAGRAVDAAALSQEAGKTLTIPIQDAAHASLIRFAYDLVGHRWDREVVDLTNSGIAMFPYGLVAAAHRDLPARMFYQCSLCDGDTVYQYDRSTNQGQITDFRPGVEPPDQSLLRWAMLMNIDEGLYAALTSGRSVVASIEANSLGGASCIELHIKPASNVAGRGGTSARVWLVPGQQPSVLRQEVLTSDAAGVPVRMVVVSSDGFGQLSPDVTLPSRVRIDEFWYGQHPMEADAHIGEGAKDDPWWSTTILECGNPPIPGLQVNRQIEVVTPYAFPFDAEVQDSSRHAPGGAAVLRPPSKLLAASLARRLQMEPPDRAGASMTPEIARSMARGE